MKNKTIYVLASEKGIVAYKNLSVLVSQNPTLPYFSIRRRLIKKDSIETNIGVIHKTSLISK